MGCKVKRFWDFFKLKNHNPESQPSEEKQEHRNVNEANKATLAECEEKVSRINNEFNCLISCDNVRIFVSPDYTTEYEVNGRKYVGYKTLEKMKLGSTDMTGSFRCDKILSFKDDYESNVVVLVRNIPCFDSGDREYDSLHRLYFFHDEKSISALYTCEGYRMASLALFEYITPISADLIKLLKDDGFPV